VMELFDMPIEEIEEITSEKEKQLIMSCWLLKKLGWFIQLFS
jgi:hypothetical protein